MPDFLHENSHGRRTGMLIAGVDEVGRGPLAGPVVAAAVIWPESPRRLKLWKLIDDSKKIAAPLRAELAYEIRTHAIWSIAEASVAEIDSINILQASLLAMRRAVEQLSSLPALCLIDGNRLPKDFPCHTRALVKGDSLSLSIAAASIIAKEHRDNMMRALARDHPHYGWETNVGYGTAVHIAGLDIHGLTPHHRCSFAPVRLRMTEAVAA